MKILLATDFTEQAARAAEVAKRLAARLGDSIVLVHALEPPTMVMPEAAAEVYRLTTSMRDAAAGQLGSAAARLRLDGPAVEEVLREGLADQVIADVAREIDARLIVVGSHGRRAPARWLLGSVAERVTTAADRPVLVVREQAGGLLAAARGERPLQVVIGLDAGRASTAAVEWLRALARAIPSHAKFVHLYWPPHEYSRLGLHGPLDLVEPNDDVIRVLERELRHQITPFADEPNVSLQIRPSWGPPGEALGLAASELGADLLVVGTHQRHGLDLIWRGSVARTAVRAASVPVLCIPAPVRPARQAAAIPRLRTVLAATDLSELGDRSVPYAYALLRGTGGIVEIIHAHERWVPDPLRAYETPAPELDSKRKEQIEQRLRGLVPAGAELHGIETRVSVVDGGKAPDAILQAAARLGADAICVGSHGRSGLARVALGSVASELVQRATCPVFVLRHPPE